MKLAQPVGFLVAGLAIGVIAGRGSGGSSATPTDGAGPAGTRSVRHERSAPSSSGAAGIDRIRKAAPNEIADLTRRAMMIPDPVEMKRQLAECLLRMTAENWQDVVAGFDKLSRETGRDNPDEWKLALFRSGQVAGAQAMDVYLAAGLRKKGPESWRTLYGWSTKDSRAALAWLKHAEAGGNETTPAHYSAIIAGAALSDSQDALRLLAEIPSDRRKNCAGDFVWNVLESGGVESLDSVLEHASKMDVADPNDAKLAKDLVREVSDKLLWKADHARDVPQVCEVVLKLVEYGQDPNRTTYDALRKFQYYGMPAKLKLVETIRTAPQQIDLDLPFLAAAVMDTMNGNRDVVAVREWMDKNPESPLVPYLETRAGGAK